MLIVDGLNKTLPATPSVAASSGTPPRKLLDGVSFCAAAGELVALVGESGSGKTTLLNLVAGLDRPDAGSIRLGDTVVSALDDDAAARLRRRDYGFVFQAFHVLPHLTVLQNVALPLWLNGLDEALALGALAAVGLDRRADSWPRELSGGELQRIAVARALVHRPRLVLADEPTGNLDAANADKVLALLADAVRAQGAIGLVVTHSPAAAATADRRLRLDRDGRLSAIP
jgi:putative ABC transport system ATP-binding protein